MPPSWPLADTPRRRRGIRKRTRGIRAGRLRRGEESHGIAKRWAEHACRVCKNTAVLFGDKWSLVAEGRE